MPPKRKRPMARTTQQKDELSSSCDSAEPSQVESMNECERSTSEADMSMDSTTRIKSNVWLYAHRHPTSDGWAVCDLCPLLPAPKLISTKGGATSTLRKHLVKVHNKVELQLARPTGCPADKVSPVHRARLHQLLINAIVVDGRCFGDFRRAGFSRFLECAVPGMPCLLINPIRCIFCSGYVPPHSNTVRRSLKQLYKIHRARLVERLRGVEWISITCDFWSNRLAQSFLVLTGHYLSSTFELNNVILDFVHFEQRHLAENIAGTIQSKLEKLGILNAVSSVTCDGASNMKKTFDKLTNIDRIWCLAHRLHLIVTNSLGFWLKLPVVDVEEETIDNEPILDVVVDDESESAEEESIDEVDDDPDTDDTVTDDDEVEVIRLLHLGRLAGRREWSGPVDDGWAEGVDTGAIHASEDLIVISELMRRCRSLTTSIKRSSVIKSALEKASSRLGIQRTLVIDVCTRWNSTLRMIESFIALKPVVTKLFDDMPSIELPRKQMAKLEKLELTSSDWTLLKLLAQLLKPFDLATKLLSSQTYPTIGLCVFALHHIKMFLEDTDGDSDLSKRLKRHLLKTMTKYIDDEKEQLRIVRVSL
ncbi:unnamed protein product [Adineta ricciae]|uniref:BED-type domain-containing protein n=1 Tax=Adineta ricciae TaxID=249248 RepID=A0A815W535_ADIRI|nr:unnamed protein product [Adineta ricciae]